MEKINDYKILTATDANSLAEKILKDLKDNFQPYGSLVVNNGLLCQPMVKYGEDVEFNYDGSQEEEWEKNHRQDVD